MVTELTQYTSSKQGKKVHKAVVNDLATYDVTVEECAPSGMIPLEYVSYNGGRVTYKGRISGLTVFQNRYIVFHALGHGIYSFDTSDETLTKVFDTTDDLVRYGVMEYNKGQGVPNHEGSSLYFIPQSLLQHRTILLMAITTFEGG